VLDTYFKRYFWTFTLLVLFGAAFQSARTVNAFLAEALTPSPADLTRGSAGPVRKAAEKEAGIPITAFLDRNLFKAEREDLTPPPAAPAGELTDASKPAGEFSLENCGASSLGANLLATFLDTRDPEASMAVFQDTTPDQKTIGVRIGDRLLDQAEVKVIDWREVYVDNGGKCESFSLAEEAKAARTAAAPPVNEAPAGETEGDLGEGIKKVTDSEYTIPRQEIDNVLSNLNQVATQARIVPSFSNGKANGFKLFSIRPNSLYSKIGIQNGDIVQKINGYEINSPDKALEIYSKLKDAQSITVDLVRRGKQQTLSYSIR
jgi:general secretion pathway protein C